MDGNEDFSKSANGRAFENMISLEAAKALGLVAVEPKPEETAGPDLPQD